MTAVNLVMFVGWFIAGAAVSQSIEEEFDV